MKTPRFPCHYQSAIFLNQTGTQGLRPNWQIGTSSIPSFHVGEQCYSLDKQIITIGYMISEQLLNKFWILVSRRQ
jgi:hypothetical protein